MKNLTPKEGYKNRHVDGMPTEQCYIIIIINDSTGERREVCLWTPGKAKPSDTLGYVGTAWSFETGNEKIGYNAWEQNNAEFVYYQITLQMF